MSEAMASVIIGFIVVAMITLGFTTAGGDDSIGTTLVNVRNTTNDELKAGFGL